METEILALVLGALLGAGGTWVNIRRLARKRAAKLAVPADPNPALALYQQHKQGRLNG